MKSTTCARAAIAAGAVLFLAAAYADVTAQLELRLVLWIAGGILSAPALLYLMLLAPVAPPAAGDDDQDQPAAVDPGPAPAIPAPRRAAGELRPSPRPRQLTS
jgi:hypothetical protein